MAFTARDVADLRERTGCGMMDCKKALTEADGDFDKAVDILREKGLAASAKKAGRIATEGMVYAYVDGGTGVAVEVNAETDFVAKNADFIAFVETVAKTIAENDPADVDALAELKASGSDMTVAELLREKILVIGENIKIRRFVKYQGAVVSYVHAGGKIGVLVKFDTADDVASKEAFTTFGKDIAMQIAAVSPQYIRRDDVPEDVVEKEKAILTEQLKNDEKNANKPPQVIEKIVAGRIGKFFSEVCLLDQSFVKEQDIKVSDYIARTGKELGGEITVAAFTRFEKGEGLEKREDNFADEVAGMIK
ncbi:MAG: translation elongation factor Ts [Oscillospiraceae bacterium]|nr:translation elongation factor Ts [Oscillospiraceae bacterium]